MRLTTGGREEETEGLMHDCKLHIYLINYRLLDLCHYFLRTSMSRLKLD